MLPAKNRLKLSFYDAKKGFAIQRVSSEELTLIYRREPKIFKAAVVVGRKVAPKAVSRNRIKRLVSEALTEQKKIGGEVIVIVKKNIATYKRPQVTKKLDVLFQKVK